MPEVEEEKVLEDVDKKEDTKQTIHRVCVFCGSCDGNDPAYLIAGRAMGTALLKSKFDLIYGGGSVGVMAAVSQTVHKGGGKVTGVIPKALEPVELSGAAVGIQIVVPDMHTRKQRMHKLADAFIALPGGYGTLEELFEVMCWAQLGIHRKPIGILNVKGFFDPLLELLAKANSEGFLRSHGQLIAVDQDPEKLLEKMLLLTLPQGLATWK